MKYLSSSQIIPSKGISHTMYEIDESDKIIRMLTSIPDIDEIHIYPKPPVKKLYKPELCETVSEIVFKELWAKAEQKDN